MKRIVLLAVCAALLAAVIPATGLAVEYQLQKENLIRLHVVGASNSASDQDVKLLVRDAVLRCVEDGVNSCANVQEAKTYLLENLDAMECVANAALAEAGSTDSAVVTLCEEAFPVRKYDTFTLPSGVYTSLRVTIGEGEGRNWWCVVFPSFCIGAASDGFLDTAAGAGFSEPLRNTLAGNKEYEIGFFILDCIGKLENFFHFG